MLDCGPVSGEGGQGGGRSTHKNCIRYPDPSTLKIFFRTGKFLTYLFCLMVGPFVVKGGSEAGPVGFTGFGCRSKSKQTKGF